jgi:hypothetical protein
LKNLLFLIKSSPVIPEFKSFSRDSICCSVYVLSLEINSKRYSVSSGNSNNSSKVPSSNISSTSSLNKLNKFSPISFPDYTVELNRLLNINLTVMESLSFLLNGYFNLLLIL